MTEQEIVGWLREDRPARLADLWRQADRVREENVGGEVHLRALIELSNYCIRMCVYCGLRAANSSLRRYRMTDDEVLRGAHHAVRLGCGTTVLQSGEDPGLSSERIAGLVRRIKAETPLAVTLSLGERTDDELAAWREAGADRYLLRFETANRQLYERIHPARGLAYSSRHGEANARSSDGAAAEEGPSPSPVQERHPRLAILAALRDLGYEVGSGVMIGIPGQTWADLAADIALFAELDLDMIGVGPYVVNPGTPLAEQYDELRAPGGEQVPADELTTYKVIALTRLVCPRANIPSTTALATIGGAEARDLGLERGANVVMPNFTPMPYRTLYEIYPGKACLAEDADQCAACLSGRVARLGRSIGTGPGHSPNMTSRRQ
ncbi:MAG: radical SAM protein [Thermoguttaceae bacterium]|nr:radical SAM protein [Thermoguttaceae bacterium]